MGGFHQGSPLSMLLYNIAAELVANFNDKDQRNTNRKPALTKSPSYLETLPTLTGYE